MKNIESNNFTYTQKNIVVGNRVRNVILIDKKPGTKLEKNKISNTSHKTISIGRKKCGGCSRKRRG